MFLLNLRNFLTINVLLIILPLLIVAYMLFIRYKILREIYSFASYFIRTGFLEFSHYVTKILLLSSILKNLDAVTSNQVVKALFRFTFLGHLYIFTSFIVRYRAVRLLPWSFYRIVQNNIYFMSIYCSVIYIVTLSVVQEIVDDSEILTLKLWS